MGRTLNATAGEGHREAGPVLPPGRRHASPLTLGRVFFLTLAGLGVVGAVVFVVLLRGWRRSLAESSRPSSDHARRACQAALACREASRRLHASPDWESRPRFHTRFGIHRDQVLVGHFGAPDRMSYTALGDGVNLASRLEGLNKQYGTTIIVSEAVQQTAGDGFAFRLLDRVAVKGKSKAVQVYELLGAAGADAAGDRTARVYEEALTACFDRRFDDALGRLEGQTEDGPSRVLAERCRMLALDLPPADWDGVFVARTK